jgi:hypothetical protein
MTFEFIQKVTISSSVNEVMVCSSGYYDRNNKLQPAILYPSSGNIDEIILARAMGFSWDCKEP